MATPSDVRISTLFPGHPKVKKLERRLGAQGVLGLIYLWVWAGSNRTTGRLDGLSAEDIAIAAQWPSDPDQFVKSLHELRFLDLEGDAYILHGWAEHQPWVAGSQERSEHARKAAHAKHAKLTTALSVPNTAPGMLNSAQSMLGAVLGKAPFLSVSSPIKKQNNNTPRTAAPAAPFSDVSPDLKINANEMPPPEATERWETFAKALRVKLDDEDTRRVLAWVKGQVQNLEDATAERILALLLHARRKSRTPLKLLFSGWRDRYAVSDQDEASARKLWRETCTRNDTAPPPPAELADAIARIGRLG